MQRKGEFPVANNESFDDEDFCEIECDDDLGYCQRCGGRIGKDGNCEICGDNHKWTWFLPEKSDKVKCTNCGTDIYKTRRYCFSCGEKNEAAFKKGERYCPKCGVAFENGVCPNCGTREMWFLNRSIKENQLGFCSKCSNQINADDFFCIYCGNENYIDKPFRIVTPRKKNNPYARKGRYCQKCGGNIYFNEDLFASVCNKCRDDNEWSYFEPKNNKNTIKCRNCGEEMYEVRRFCKNCGEVNELAFKKGEHYCPGCGIAFENGVCPECGRTLEYFQQRDLEPNKKRYCPSCETEVSKDDDFCINCGNENYIYSPLEVPKSVAAREEKEFLERMEARKELRSKQLKEYNERNERRREERRRIREEAERKRESEQTETIKTAAKIPEQSKTTQSPGYSGYYFADLHTTLWLVLGIVSLVICCLPTGIGTIICSIGAKRAENELEYNIAKRKTIFAKIWFFAGCAIVLAFMVAAVVAQVSQM